MHYDADVQLPADAKAVIVSPSIVGDRFVQLTPAYTGGQVLADGATLDQTQHRRAARARPDLLQPRRPHHGARPQRRQQEGRPDRPARHHGRQLRRAGEEVPPDHRELQPPQRRPSPTTRTTCSGRCASSRASSTRWPATTTRSAASTRSLAQVSGMLKGERGDLAASLHNLGHRAAARCRGFVADNRADPGQEHHRPRRGHPDPGQAALRAGRDPAGRAAGPEQPGADLQPAGRNPRHPRQPRRAGQPDHLRPVDVPVRHPRPGQPGRPGLQR